MGDLLDLRVFLRPAEFDLPRLGGLEVDLLRLRGILLVFLYVICDIFDDFYNY
jgi:hypothetical protein